MVCLNVTTVKYTIKNVCLLQSRFIVAFRMTNVFFYYLNFAIRIEKNNSPFQCFIDLLCSVTVQLGSNERKCVVVLLKTHWRNGILSHENFFKCGLFLCYSKIVFPWFIKCRFLRKILCGLTQRSQLYNRGTHPSVSLFFSYLFTIVTCKYLCKPL